MAAGAWVWVSAADSASTLAEPKAAPGSFAGVLPSPTDAAIPLPPAALAEELVGEQEVSAEPTDPVQPPSQLPVTAGPQTYLIGIDATGYQAELDECLWVRMDLGAVAPIVGAHTHCGGEIVLGMAGGDTVQLSGELLGGMYTVGESRDAHPGDVASIATAGMAADVLLQTCYPGGATVKLVELRRVRPS